MQLIAETARLTLRELCEADLSAMRAIFCDPITLQAWPFTLSADEVRAMLARAQASYAAHRMGLWAICSRETGELVGTAGMRPTANAGEIELLWHLNRNHWHKGYATEAALELVELARAQGATRIIAPILPNNSPSQRVAQRLGMTIDGRTELHGHWHEVWATR